MLDGGRKEKGKDGADTTYWTSAPVIHLTAPPLEGWGHKGRPNVPQLTREMNTAIPKCFITDTGSNPERF